MPKQVYMARDERKLQILQMARAAASASPHKPVMTHNPTHPYLITAKTHWTTANMARWLGLSVSTKFRNILYELADCGYLCCVFVPYPSGAVTNDKAVFCLPEYHVEQLEIDF